MSIIEKFQEKYPTKDAKVKALSDMTNDQIDELIKASGNVQAKIFYSSFKKKFDDSAESSIEERFNPNHNGKTGRFAPKNGGGTGGGSSSEGGFGLNDLKKKEDI